MQTVNGFCDFCVSSSGTSNESLREICVNLITLGYKSIAINTNIDESMFETKKKKKGESKESNKIDVVPTPTSLEFLEDLKQKLQIFHRLTVEFAEPASLMKLNQSENIKKYHLIAVIPTTTQAFQFACSTLEIDIISFNSESKNFIKFNRKLYNQAVSRGIFFELMYAPAIIDTTRRKNIIHTAHLYHVYGKSKNIFVSSGANDSFHVRGPYDIINLALLFGLNEQQAKNCITSVCRDLIIKANGRRHGKAVMFVSSNEMSNSNVNVEVNDVINNPDLDHVEQTRKKIKLENK